MPLKYGWQNALDVFTWQYSWVDYAAQCTHAFRDASWWVGRKKKGILVNGVDFDVKRGGELEAKNKEQQQHGAVVWSLALSSFCSSQTPLTAPMPSLNKNVFQVSAAHSISGTESRLAGNLTYTFTIVATVTPVGSGQEGCSTANAKAEYI